MTITTESDTLALTPDALTLVRVSRDYLGTTDAWADAFSSVDVSEDALTFYATTSDIGDEYATLVVPDDDDRSRGFWTVSGTQRLGLDTPHRGWNILRSYLTPYADERPRPASADIWPGDGRRDLPVEEAYPVGSRWRHTPSGAVVTVLGHNHGDHFILRVSTSPENSNPTWVRGALDAYGEFIGWDADHTPSPEATTGPETDGETYSRADVDRLVAEAREAAKAEADAALEAFKETANARAIEYAQANGLCSEFERCMSDIGLMGRDEWREAHRKEYRVTFTVSVDVSASDEYEAESEARSELYEDLSYPMDQTVRHHSTAEV